MTNRWYAVHAYSNFENKVAESIREQAKQRGLSQLFEEILVPKEKVVEVRRGRKVDAERKFFPGYVLVKMEMTDEAYHLIKNTPKVTGFLGSDNKPMPLSDAEAERILHQVQEGIERPKPSVSFEVGEQVRVSDGPFASFNGTVEEVDEGRSRLKVAVSIRWRSYKGFPPPLAGEVASEAAREGASLHRHASVRPSPLPTLPRKRERAKRPTFSPREGSRRSEVKPRGR
jgi:transcriptional antiterminator NusG